MNRPRMTLMHFLSAAALAAPLHGALPPRIAALVPPDTRLVSQSFTGVPTMAVAEFVAEKSLGIGRTVEYHLVVRAFDNGSPAWKLREVGHRRQMEARIEQGRRGLVPETANLGLFTADPVKETRNAWGSGLTQRLLHHPPRAEQFVDYSCAYYGLLGGIVFELSVSGMPDRPDGADQWAQAVATAAAKLTVANIGDR